jgi:GNAT superfamily N-acetyltransferase
MTGGEVEGAARIREATAGDVAAVVALLADDPLGATRESPGDLAPYRAAFEVVDADPRQLLVVAERDGRVVGTLQLTLLPGLARRGALRGSGLGTALVRWAIDEARRRGCVLVQLTSDASRADAHRFYERLGFVPSHVGFKLALH